MSAQRLPVAQEADQEEEEQEEEAEDEIEDEDMQDDDNTGAYGYDEVDDRPPPTATQDDVIETDDEEPGLLAMGSVSSVVIPGSFESFRYVPLV